jgi:hypothetical protein
MSFRKMLLPLIAVAGLSSSYALAADELKVTAQYKGWFSSNEDSDQYRNYVSLAAKYGNFFALISPGIKKTGDSDLTWGGTKYKVPQSNTETDIAFGYYLIPELAITLSHKTYKTESNWSAAGIAGIPSGCSVTAKLPMIGVAGGMGLPVLSAKAFVYGNANTSFSEKVDDNCRVVAGVQQRQYESANYTNYEIGVGYRIDNNISATLGYRELRTKVKRLPAFGGTENSSTTNGATLAISYTF